MIDLLNTPPIQIRYEEVFDPDKDLGIREIPSGVSLTPSGFFAIFIIGVHFLMPAFKHSCFKFLRNMLDYTEENRLDLGSGRIRLRSFTIFFHIFCCICQGGMKPFLQYQH